MHIEPLSLSHQTLLEKKLRHLNMELSEYSFANLYLFRHLHQYEVIHYENEIFIQGVTRDGLKYIMPTSDPAKIPLKIFQFLLSSSEVLFPIPDNWLQPFEKNLLQASFRDEDTDYLFAVSKLAHFPGRHLSKKRNLVKQLLESYEVKIENLSNHIEEGRRILEEWKKEYRGNPLETDYEGCKLALDFFEQLHLHGRIIFVDHLSAGFTIGEWLSDKCYVIHFSKGKKQIKGIYQYLYQDLAQTVESSCEWINIEQDLGIQSIRESKHSYLPDKLLRKWRVKLQF